MNRCKRFDFCDASLCPEDPRSLAFGLWYPGEEICRLRRYQGLLFVANQRKIQRRAKGRETYYTYPMLNRSIIIRKAIRGLSPDRDRKAQEEAWIRSHPGFAKCPEKGGFVNFKGRVNGLVLPACF